ncbi:ANTAR domain-containing protein [Friedmanniella luteola]|uniref:ANTAR domain-containing protein n=1 Tax=Friedmanniella luteola TaxID=546871 RepID=A0A1H1ZG08_9ACTN|nr:GAF and ANTAR domain-containing protein [Friedmanniella luteola]SDT32711.1 ANTAR domain-containing protein [Friedmanniella luteola]
MDEPDQAHVLQQLARVVAAAEPDAPLSLRLCAACTSILGLQGGAVTLAYEDPGRTTLCVTDERAAQVEDLQEILGEGPSYAAARENRMVAVTVDGEPDPRWPLFTAAVQQALGGPCTVVAVPISPGDRPIGVATFYRRRVDTSLPLPGPTVRLLVDAVGVALTQTDAEDDVLQQQAGSWVDRARINQAVGMVMAQLRMRPDDALALLRAHAYAHQASLGQIAGEVVERRLDFKGGDAERPAERPDGREER